MFELDTDSSFAVLLNRKAFVFNLPLMLATTYLIERIKLAEFQYGELTVNRRPRRTLILVEQKVSPHTILGAGLSFALYIFVLVQMTVLGLETLVAMMKAMMLAAVQFSLLCL